MTKIAELVVGVVRELGDGEALAFTEPRTPEEGLVAALPGANPATVEKKVAAKAPGSG